VPSLNKDPHFWAKTAANGVPGISVRDHCINVGNVAEAILSELHERVYGLLPIGAATLAALHDIGKITLGFQIKCPHWLLQQGLPEFPKGEQALSVSDHALISQAFLVPHLGPEGKIWSVAVGSHHGKPKGKTVKRPLEAQKEWFEQNRSIVSEELRQIFGPLPTVGVNPRFSKDNSDLWLLAGLITMADWIGSNEKWFPPDHGLSLKDSRLAARRALKEIGWPGGKLRKTDFATAFAGGPTDRFVPTALQSEAERLASNSRIMIIEGPMGCGKTEAALFAAQQLIGSGLNAGIYFALPTQITSNRIHRRVEQFLRNSLEGEASFRLAHGSAWLEDTFDLNLRPAYPIRDDSDIHDVRDNLSQARSWFASSKQALLAPYGVGTVDQALQSIVAVKYFFVRRFALAGKVVILDEVHSYDVYTGTLITSLIRELVNLQCSVIILSATLTAARRQELMAAAGFTELNAPTAYPLLTSGDVQGHSRHVCPEWHSQKIVKLRAEAISEDEAVEELIQRAEDGQHVLWIRNTVLEAQHAYRTIVGRIREGAVRLGLLHSRFPFQRRAELEDDWLERLGKNRIEDCGSILIATQVVEQSVDIDLDFIVSDLAPTDMLLQRVGRLWRHERPSRKATEPVFWVRLPECSAADTVKDLTRALGRSARVYTPYVLLRTAEVWRTRATIVLPKNIRPILEETYADPASEEPATLQQLRQELEEEKRELASFAEAATLVLGRPALCDSDEILTRRKGAPTTPLLLVKSIRTRPKRTVVVESLAGDTIEIGEFDWRRSAAKFIHTWTVRAPTWMVPKTASSPAWLKLHGPSECVVAEWANNGICVFESEKSAIRYTPELGIFAETPSRNVSQPQWNDDDEFDY
jgi:CRISPR-associated endonuclease/helicase Cas3